MEKPCQLTLLNGKTASAIKVQNPLELAGALQELGLKKPRPTLVLVGGASGLSDIYLRHLQTLFIKQIAPLVESLGAYVIDGGTDAGIMRLMGKARHEIGATFPLIGVAAIGTVIVPDIIPAIKDPAPLEPHHTHFMLVPGTQWGDECTWIAQLATVISDSSSSVTMVVNGGKITFQDVAWSIKANRPVIVVAGSGRTADILSAALQGDTTHQEATSLATSGLIQAIDFTKDLDLLVKYIQGQLDI